MEPSFDERAKGIRKRKKVLILGVTAAFTLLGILCVVLFSSNIRLKKELLSIKRSIYGDKEYEDSGIYSTQGVDVYENPDGSLSGEESDDGQKKVYLTFDDGPSPNTGKILDILDKYDAKATFFVIGKDREIYADELIRMTDEGHSIGMHSYSHVYSEVYASPEAFKEDLEKLQEFIYETTGVWSRLYRFPGGSSNTVSSIPITDLIGYLNDQGIVYFDWNIASGDAVSTSLSAERIRDNCLRGIDKYDECVILMHDTSDRASTVEALPGLIEEIQKRGDCVILPITDDTRPVQHVTLSE